MADMINFKRLKDSISSALIDTTRTAGQISNEDLAFHRSTNPSVAPLLEAQTSRLLSLVRNLVNVATSGSALSAPQSSGVDYVEDNWKDIVDVFDGLLEKADESLDEYTGVIKRLSPSREESTPKAINQVGKQRPGKAYRTQDIAKPQLLFAHVPANDEKTPFKPLLRTKPHAMISLEESLALTDAETDFRQYDTQFHLSLKDNPLHFQELIDTRLRYRHPYEIEIKTSQYPPSARVVSDAIPYLPYESTKASLVDTPQGVMEMLEELKKAKEIAVDLEHHDEHSYTGLVSLMQISTRDKDWVVDTLKPWREDLQALNEVFVNPDIIKVFHGAFMDIIWLQRDLGLYVVGLFDTYHACAALGYPKRSLAYLLKRFANFDAAKQYQMADWRIRPLPNEMFNYARSDTHFLLFIYDNMRNELIQNSSPLQTEENLIESVMRNSKEESLQRYERPMYDEQRGSGPMGWYNMLCRTPALFNRQQFAVFRAVHRWRDMVARQEDESVHVIMPKHVLYNIARETPNDMPSMLGCSHPISKPLLRRQNELLNVVKQAKDRAATEPEMKDLMLEVGSKTSKDVGNVRRGFKEAAKKSGQGFSPLSNDFSRGLPIRSRISRFWGLTMSETPSSRTMPENVRLALPLPQLTAEIFSDYKALNDTKAHVDSRGSAMHQDVKVRSPKSEEILVIKKGGGSRKRKAAAIEKDDDAACPRARGDPKPGEQIQIELQDDAEARQARAKREKHERRLERRQERKQSILQDDKDHKLLARADKDAAKVFDFDQAPSIFHAKSNENDRRIMSNFANPYAKSANAPKGMRKSKTQIGGKSYTFKG